MSQTLLEERHPVGSPRIKTPYCERNILQEGGEIMVELVLSYALKFVGLGVVCYLVHNIFSKNTKDFDCSIDQNGIKIRNTFYKE